MKLLGLAARIIGAGLLALILYSADYAMPIMLGVFTGYMLYEAVYGYLANNDREWYDFTLLAVLIVALIWYAEDSGVRISEVIATAVSVLVVILYRYSESHDHDESDLSE